MADEAKMHTLAVAADWCRQFVHAHVAADDSKRVRLAIQSVRARSEAAAASAVT